MKQLFNNIKLYVWGAKRILFAVIWFLSGLIVMLVLWPFMLNKKKIKTYE